LDAGNDGARRAGDPGIGGVTVTLTGRDDRGNAVSLSTTTGDDGSYAFTGLRPSDAACYTVTEGPVAAPYLDGKANGGDRGGVVAHDAVTSVTVSPGASGKGYDFGELLPGSVGGAVFEDVNGDGLRQDGETGLAGVAVHLLDRAGNVVSATTTGADGRYSFTGLTPGTYRVREVVPDGWLQTSAAPADVALSGGATAADVGFGNAQGAAGHAGDTATIGFWNNKNGRGLIKSCGNAADGRSLANWLAGEFPSLFGKSAGAGNDLTGKSNADVASYFQGLFNIQGQ